MALPAIAGSFAHTIHPQPLIHGERFTFKPTRNFEFGFSRTGMFAGQGVPFTLHTFEKSFFGTGNGAPGTVNDPGDRRSGMDWTYRVPKLRDWVTFYGDAFADDQISPSPIGTAPPSAAVFFSPMFRASQNLICALKASIRICRPGEH